MKSGDNSGAEGARCEPIMADPVDGVAQTYPRPAVAWGSVAVLMLLFTMAYLDRQIISLMVAPIRAEFAIGDFEISLLQGFAFAVLYAVCGLPLGMAVDRFPRRFIILGGVLIWSLATMACAFAQTFGHLLAARVLVGAGEAALAPAAYSLLADLFPKRRLTFALSVFMLGALFGAEGSLAIGGTILHQAAGGVTLPMIGEMPAWRFAFLAVGTPGIVIAFAALLLHEPVRHKVAAGTAGGWGEVFRFMSTRKLFFFVQLLGFASVMALVYARFAWNPTFLMRSYGWSVEQASYTLAIFGFVTGVPALLLGGRIVDMVFERGMTDAHFRYYVAGGVILAICGGAAYVAPAPGWFLAAMVLPTLPLSMGAIGASAVQLVTPQHLRGRVSAIYLLAVGLIGMTAGPAIVGAMTDYVFADPDSLGLAMSITYVTVGALIAILFLIGMPAMRKAVANPAD